MESRRDFSMGSSFSCDVWTDNPHIVYITATRERNKAGEILDVSPINYSLRRKDDLFKSVLVIFIVISIALMSPSACFSEIKIEDSVKKEVWRTMLDNKITIIPQLNKIATGFGNVNSKEYYFVKTISKIFFQDKNVAATISRINFNEDGIAVKLSNDMLGEGEITIVFFHKDTYVLGYADIEYALKSSLSSPSSAKVVVNKNTKIFHLSTSNHLPNNADAEMMDMGEALDKGNKPCGYCFMSMTYIPDGDLEHKLARQGAASLRHLSPLVVDNAVQEYVRTLGNRVLSKWPLPLIGYRYNFQVIEDAEPNAFALPCGHVMVTSALLNSVENEEELEAVLAHEVAHVERRHTLRNYYIELEKLQAQKALYAFGMTVAGIAAASNNQDAAMVSLAATVVGMIAIGAIDSGYPKEYEREADEIAILYFEKNHMDKINLGNVFKKFSFMSLVKDYNPNPQSLTHPYLEERINLIDRSILQTFENKHFISPKYPIQLDFIYQSYSEDNTSLFIHFNDRRLVDKINDCGNKASLVVGDEKGIKEFRFDRHGIIRDSWGGYFLLKATGNSILENIKDVSLALEIKGSGTVTNITDPSGATEDRSERYEFREGVIDF